MSGSRDLQRLSLGLIIGGALLLVIAIVLYATAPASRPMPSANQSFDDFSRNSDDWFESTKAHDHAVFEAAACGIFGIGLLGGGLRMSRRGRAMQMAYVEQGASAIGRGLGRGLHADDPNTSAAARLSRLEELHRKGLLSDDELKEKRAEIIDAL